MIDWARRHQTATYYLLAFAITWAVWVPRAAESRGWLSTTIFTEAGRFWTYGPLVAAVLAAALGGGRRGLHGLAARLGRWRVGARWYGVALVVPALIAFAVAGVHLAMGESWAAARPVIFADGLGWLPVVLIALTLTDGLGEEPGWRGFALPRLLRGRGAAAASVLLGVAWAAWHLPLFWTAGATLQGTSIPLLFLELPAKAILFTWLFGHTRGSALLAVLFHGSFNAWGLPQHTDGSLLLPLINAGVMWLAVLAVLVVPGARRFGATMAVARNPARAGEMIGRPRAASGAGGPAG